MKLFDTVTELESGAGALRDGRYGVIEAAGGRLVRVRLRPFPKRVALLESRLLGAWIHGRRAGDRCLVYYNQPRRFPQFLAVQYVVSARDTTFATFRRALELADDIARLKGCEALLCDASNARISDRLLARWGWEPHAPMRWRRNFIKRLK